MPNQNQELLVRWFDDLETATATHCDGWVFHFTPVDGEPGAFDGECLKMPSPMTPELFMRASDIIREAGEAYFAARDARH